MPSMVDLPADPKKLRARLRRYERKLADEKRGRGGYDDGAGKRYFVAPMYLVLGDQQGALDSFAWYEREFPRDRGDAGHYLCWALALHRVGAAEKAEAKLRLAMFANRLALPKLLGLDPEEVGIVPDPDDLAPMYLEGVPERYYSLWSDDELAWTARLFHGEEWTALRARFFEIEALLEGEPRGPRRTALVKEMSAIRR